MLAGPAAAVREAFRPGEVLGLGLRLSADAARALAGSPASGAEARALLRDRGLRVATVNAFPAGEFHGPRVKEGVYFPDWLDQERIDYTVDAARAAGRLLDPGETCVLSTVPGTWKRARDGPSATRGFARGLAEAARRLRDLSGGTGIRFVVAPEPEPGCTLETVDETIAFWSRDLPPALGRDADVLLPHLGICVDLCHLAVAGEDAVPALARLRRAGVPVAKVQVSAALEVRDPAADGAAVEALRRFDEPRWLHQAGGRDRLGVVRRAADLPELFGDLDGWRRLAPWRIHFHAPLHEAAVAGVATTRDLVPPALRAVLAAGEPLPPFEVETYTWSAVPGSSGDAGELAASIAAELRFARDALAPS
jgi:sugar phosphate isomerase/epimerase